MLLASIIIIVLSALAISPSLGLPLDATSGRDSVHKRTTVGLSVRTDVLENTHIARSQIRDSMPSSILGRAVPVAGLQARQGITSYEVRDEMAQFLKRYTGLIEGRSGVPISEDNMLVSRLFGGIGKKLAKGVKKAAEKTKEEAVDGAKATEKGAKKAVTWIKS